MPNWQPYHTTVDHTPTIDGDVRIWHDFDAPALGNQRHVAVYLPPSYAASERRYPVLYMHDGQNLFDGEVTFAGEWQVDETCQRLAQEGLELIVVGVYNSDRRMNEYNPYTTKRFGAGDGAAYIDFVADAVKPQIDRDFRTLPEAAQTGIAGSSMGGLISLYGALARPDSFQFAAAFSPSLQIAQPLYRDVANWTTEQNRVYLDCGTAEAMNVVDGPKLYRRLYSFYYLRKVRQMAKLLRRKPTLRNASNFRYVEARGAVHNESAWAKRFPDAVRFWLSGL